MESPNAKPVPHPRRFRFGVKCRRARSFAELAEQARELEDLGYSTLLMSDHFWDVLAPLPACAAAAAATTRLRVGTNVLGNDFRHPVVLAKEVASVDRLSGGRFELGHGAGWMREDYEKSGMTMDRPGVRVERMAEALRVMRGLWADGPLDFEGSHYRIRGLEGFPKPAQRPGPPVLIGGGGKRILSVAARLADIVGLNPIARSGSHDEDTDHDATAGATDRKLGWLREAAGERFDALEISMNAYLAKVSDDAREGDRLISERFRVPVGEAREIAHALVGSIDSIVETLQARRERWASSYCVISEELTRDFAPVVARLAGS